MPETRGSPDYPPDLGKPAEKPKNSKKLNLFKKIKRPKTSLRSQRSPSRSGEANDELMGELDGSPQMGRRRVSEPTHLYEAATSPTPSDYLDDSRPVSGEEQGGEEENNDDLEVESIPVPSPHRSMSDQHYLRPMADMTRPAPRSRSFDAAIDYRKSTRQDSPPASPTPAEHSLVVHLKSGHDLVSCDSNGLSDPYVKLKMGSGYSKAKSSIMFKTLTPIWNEEFVLRVQALDDPLLIRVYDKDIVGKDDFMGRHLLHLGSLPLNQTVERKLLLDDPDGDVTEDYGYLVADFTLKVIDPSDSPPSKLKQKKSSRSHSMFPGSTQASLSSANFLNASGSSVSRRLSRLQSDTVLPACPNKCAMPRSVVSITLLSGSKLAAMDDNGLSDPYVKFYLGSEKCKSRVINKTLDPEWKEKFELRIMDGQLDTTLNVTVWDRDYASRDDFMGSLKVDLSKLEPDRTHTIDEELQDGEGRILFLVTITGMKDEMDGADESDPLLLQQSLIQSNYGWRKTLTAMGDIGILMVKVIRAKDLAVADYGGTSDPFCTLELGNSHVRTETIYKNCNPEWSKIFFLKVKDIHALLDITVMDEDRAQHEFLGRVVIPLLSITPGEEKWYALKDRKLRTRYKGQLLLSFDLIYNPIRASIRTFSPKEQNYLETEEKFSRQVLSANIGRVASQVRTIKAFLEFLNSLFLWKSKMQSLTAFIVFIIVTLVFDLWMIFAGLLMVFLYQYYAKGWNSSTTRSDSPEELDSDDELEDKDKKGLRQRLQDIYNICQTVQNVLDSIASIGERVKNTVNWTIPFQSWLAIIALSIAMLITYLIPLRYLILLWGINKFTKKLRKPNFIPNNELLDFLSRVPSDPELAQRSFLPIQEARPMSPDRSRKKKKRA